LRNKARVGPEELRFDLQNENEQEHQIDPATALGEDVPDVSKMKG
jgi:hypothetical protein